MRERRPSPSPNVIGLSERRKARPQGEQPPDSGNLATVFFLSNIEEVHIPDKDPHDERIAYIRQRMGHDSNSGAIRDAVRRYHDLLKAEDRGDQIVAITKDNKVRDIIFDATDDTCE